MICKYGNINYNLLYELAANLRCFHHLGVLCAGLVLISFPDDANLMHWSCIMVKIDLWNFVRGASFSYVISVGAGGCHAYQEMTGIDYIKDNEDWKSEFQWKEIYDKIYKGYLFETAGRKWFAGKLLFFYCFFLWNCSDG